MLIYHQYILSEMFVQIFCPLKKSDLLIFLLLSCERSLYILHTSPLSGNWKYFLACLSFLTVLFWGVKVFNFYKLTSYQFFPFMDCASGLMVKKLGFLRPQRFSSIFCAISFIILDLIFRFFDMFKVNFFIWWEYGSKVFSFFKYGYPIILAPFVIILFQRIVFVPLTRINWPKSVVLFLNSFPLIYLSLS